MIITDRELEIVCLIADRHRTLEKKVLCRVQISRLFHSFIHFYAGFPEVLTEKEEECSQLIFSSINCLSFPHAFDIQFILLIHRSDKMLSTYNVMD